MSATLFFNGHILTQDKSQPNVEAVLIEGQYIKEIGEEAVLRGMVDSNIIEVDLKGKTLIPGLNDAHIHVWKVGHLLTSMLDLRGVTSITRMLEMVKEFAEGLPEGQWLMARGFNEAVLAEKRIPTREEIDSVVSDRPVILTRTCAHIISINSKAMEICEIQDSVEAPPGGIILRDEENKPTGVFCETALGLIHKYIPSPTIEQYEAMLDSASNELLSYGITSATDPGVLPELMAVYKNLDDQSKLKLRFNVMAIRLPDGGTEVLPLPEKHVSDQLRVDTIKFFSDGGLSGKTASVKRNYKGYEEKGILRFDEQRFYDMAVEGHRAGFRIGTHAIGDNAIDVVVGTYKRLCDEFPSEMRHRVEHLGLPEKSHLETMSKYNMISVPQTIFLFELGSNFRRYLDDDYLKHTFPVRSTMEAGISVALSSDAPVVKSFNPMKGIVAAVTRKDKEGVQISPEESITVEEALYGYTMGGAISTGDENNRGSITSGKWADLTILDKNPLDVEIEEIEHIKVQTTYLAGKIVYNRN
ncbi:MAG: amidohydrolase [Flavobacteriales bacterium]|nr:amidohydrolase [Flavobacteriales bacterium]